MREGYKAVYRGQLGAGGRTLMVELSSRWAIGGR